MTQTLFGRIRISYMKHFQTYTDSQVFLGTVAHVQTVDTTPLLSYHVAWVRGYHMLCFLYCDYDIELRYKSDNLYAFCCVHISVCIRIYGLATPLTEKTYFHVRQVCKTVNLIFQ